VTRWFGRTLTVLGAFVLLAACAGEDSNGFYGGDCALPARSDGTAPCGDQSVGQCDQVQRERTVPYRFSLQFSGPPETGECLVRALAAEGLTAYADYRSNVDVTGTYETVASVLALEAVDGYSVYCVDTSCCDLPVDSCARNAFCQVLDGLRYDPAQGCVTHEPAGCNDWHVCGGIVTAAIDGDGACWSFPSICIPDGFREATSADPCNYDLFAQASACSAPP
jgi:hypothetical protein